MDNFDTIYPGKITPSPDHTLFHLLLQHFTNNSKTTWGKNELLKTLNELYIAHLEARQ